MAKAAALDQRLSAEAFRVLGVLCCYADATSRCCPSVTTVGEHLGLSDRMVQRHLRRLEEMGYVDSRQRKRSPGALGHRRNGARIGGGNAANIYTLVFPTPPSLKRSDRVTPHVTPSNTDRVTFDPLDRVTPHVTQTRLDLTRKSLEEEDSVYQEETRVNGEDGRQGETRLHLVQDATDAPADSGSVVVPANGKRTWHAPIVIERPVNGQALRQPVSSQETSPAVTAHTRPDEIGPHTDSGSTRRLGFAAEQPATTIEATPKPNSEERINS
jgi:DNA-binding transcriptional ArsR family regulator